MTTAQIGLIVGGAECVWDDLGKARELLAQSNSTATLFILNDMIARFAESAVAVTLHPDKLSMWLHERRAAKLPPPLAVWAHRPHKLATKFTKDWGGSVGLFGAKVSVWEYGLKKTILCGVPMTADGKHFVRHKTWVAADAFRRAWVNQHKEIAPVVRSMSGWTADKLGKPTIEWIAAA